MPGPGRLIRRASSQVTYQVWSTSGPRSPCQPLSHFKQDRMYSLFMKIGDLAINLLASVLAFTFGWLSREAVRLYRRRWFQRIWRFNRNYPVTIVVSEDARGPIDQLATWYGADVRAAILVQLFLKETLQMEKVGIYSANDSEIKQILDGNLVIIGGPAGNPLAARVEQAISPPFNWEIDSSVCAIVQPDGTRNQQVLNGNSTIIDYSIIAITNSPFNYSAGLVYIAGCGPIGTESSAAFLTQRLAAPIREHLHRHRPTFALMETIAYAGAFGIPKFQSFLEPRQD